jgi:alcohol dehydrogenase (cytochrome c)/quinohemoprotein ethanol dehydrogenase
MRHGLLASACAAALIAAGIGHTGAANSADGRTVPKKPYGAVNEQRLLAAGDAANAGQWMSYGRTYSEQRYSPLREITTDNVSKLGLAWFANFDTKRGQESTPLVVDGTIYVTTAWSKVKAYDARTGVALWAYDPKVPGQWGVNACCDVVNRGAAVWEGKVYVGTLDGRLIALDAASGKLVWSVQTTDPKKPYTITGAPRVVKGRVIIGNGGAEFSVRGYVSAYDAQTGKLDWRFYIVPGVPGKPDGAISDKPLAQIAAKTWDLGGLWPTKSGGGGTPWDAFTYDPKLDLLYVGGGNGGPWPADIRSPGKGDNLFLSSIIALKPETGEYVWHYQEVQRDSWDYTATQQIMVADLKIDGRERHVVMQSPKNGYFYVLDAATGKLISAKNIIPLNWSTGIDMKTGRPIMNPAARYDHTGKGFIIIPTPGGAHSWHPMSYNPQTGLVYIPTMYGTYPMVATREDDNPMGQKLNISMSKGFAMYDEPGAKRINESYLLAWDPVHQKEAWRVSFGGGRGGGTLTTAGNLVFQGNSKDQAFVAYRADTGERLWSMGAQTSIVAGPVSYEVDGDQYVAVVAGPRQSGNYYAPNYSRLLVYKLGGTAQLPPEVPAPQQVLNPPAQFGSPDLIKHGEEVYNRFCGTCHGTDGQSRGLFPDLRYSAALDSEAALDAIVLEGALTKNGMVSFKKALSKEDVNAVRAYMAQRAIDLQKNPRGGFPGRPPRAGAGNGAAAPARPEASH